MFAFATTANDILRADRACEYLPSLFALPMLQVHVRCLLENDEDAPCSGIALRAGGDAEASDAGKLQRRAADVDAEHRAEEIDLDPFDPTDRHAEIARQRGVEAGAGRRDTGPASAVGIVLADRGRRKHGAQLGH